MGVILPDGERGMKFWIYIALGVALLSLASYRQIVADRVTPGDRIRCEALVRADHVASPPVMARLLAACRRPAMVEMMEARSMGAERQSAEDILAAIRRHRALSVLIDIALVGAGIAGLSACRRHRPTKLPYRR